MNEMKKLFLALALMSALLVATGSASAHENGYNAANNQGKIVYRYNSTMTESYKKMGEAAFAAWNKERAAIGGTRFPQFVQGNSGVTLDVGLYRESGNTLGYYRYYSGSKVDLLRMNAEARTTEAAKQRTFTHESGHAGGFTHNFLSCMTSVMPQTKTCGKRTSWPAPHDREDVKNFRKKAAATAEEVEEIPVGFKVQTFEVTPGNKELVSEVLKFPDGFAVVEYAE